MKYTPLTQLDLDAIGALAGFSPQTWTGPALPRPEGAAGFAEMADMLDKLAARAQYLIQVEDGLSLEYTLNGITAAGERFLLGTEAQVQEAADLRGVLVIVESFLNRTGMAAAGAEVIADAFAALRGKIEALLEIRRRILPPPARPSVAAPPAAAADYSAFAFEDLAQFAMAWSSYGDALREGYPQVDAYARAAADPDEATRQFWPTLNRHALPYNLLVLRKLSAASVEPFRTNFGAAWLPAYDQHLLAGTLYGIDLTLFADLEPATLENGTVRFTPSAMALLTMDDRTLSPVAVYVADPQRIANAQVYTPQSPAWIYALMAVKTSLTVYGIWIGHVYTLHLVTAAMQMAALNRLPADHVIHRLLAPHSHYTIAFDLVLLLGWTKLAPPTSISDAGKFLTLCDRFSSTHDFFSADPRTALAELNLDVQDFTDPAGGQPWNLYPNVQVMLQLWGVTETYVGAVVRESYPSEGSVRDDADLAAWIAEASAADGGNVAGLPRMDAIDALIAVATSVLYRIVFHGLSRLKKSSTPELSFSPNYPPCLQSTVIPSAGTPVSAADLLKTYLPKTGTLGGMVSFYGTFAHSAPYVPMVPDKGPRDELFFDEQRCPKANQALIDFRGEIEKIVRQLQPDWVQVGQWPRNIEL